MYSGKTIMRLVDDGTLLRVQNNLLQSKNIQNLHGSWWFNVLMFFLVAGIFIFFLSTQYTSTKYIIEAEATRKDIPFKENSFHNAVRNRIDM
jgi:hypothetical protein